MSDELCAEAERRICELGYDTFSAYLQYLIRDDALKGGPHVREMSPVKSVKTVVKKSDRGSSN